MEAHGHGGGDGGGPESAAREAAIARSALDAGDLAHALLHIGTALMTDPARADWIALIDEVIAAAREREIDPLSIAPLGPESHFATVAVHAHLLADSGRTADAIGLLLEVCAVSRVGYAPWAVRWLAAVDPAAIETSAIRRGLLQLVRAHPGDRLDDKARAGLEPVVELIGPLLDAHPTDAMFQYVGSMILRKARHLPRAIATAERAHQLAPSWATAVGLAYARREAGDLEGASAAFSAAEAVDPTDQTARADHAKMLYTGGEVERGLALYESILSIEPGNQCALGAYCTYRAQAYPHEDEGLWRRLLDHVDHHPDDTESAWWLDRMAERAPYVRCLPHPTAAPGASRAAEVPPPGHEVSAAVDALANQRFFAPRWWDEATAVASAAGDAEPLVGAMHHPGQPPAGRSPWEHVYRRQVAAAFGIARLDDGWAGSPRRTALLALARGQVDWTVDAAVIALGELALRVPEALADVIELYTELLSHWPHPGHISYERPLIYAFSRLPVPESVRDTVNEWRRRIDE